MNDWQFCLYPSPDWVPEGWETNPKFDHYDAEEGWGAISVPGNWELQGRGVPIYANFTYPIPLDPPRVPANANPTGCYVKHFSYTPPPVPGKMGKRCVCVRACVRVRAHVARAFRQNAIASSASVQCFLRCVLCRCCEPSDAFIDSMLPGLKACLWSYFGEDRIQKWICITDKLSKVLCSKGSLCVSTQRMLDTHTHTTHTHTQVLRWSDATYLEDQDMWRTSGIHRDVLLCTKPALHVADIAVTTPLSFGSDEGAADGGPPLTSARLESLIYL
eukprot:scaffold7723_cov23-Tisochrysis_lutea.AAC.1